VNARNWKQQESRTWDCGGWGGPAQKKPPRACRCWPSPHQGALSAPCSFVADLIELRGIGDSVHGGQGRVLHEGRGRWSTRNTAHWSSVHSPEPRKVKQEGGSPCASVVINPTSIHEDAGSIPGFAQWVKDSCCHELRCRLKMWLGSCIAMTEV